MKRVIFLTLGIALLLIGREAIAENEPNLNRLLRGRYATTQVQTCLQNRDGFGENFVVLGTFPAASFNIFTRSIVNYNGDGTGTVTDGESINLINDAAPVGSLPVGQSQFTCNLTYTVNADRSFTEAQSCNGTILSGSAVGQTFSQTGIQFQGQIAQGRRTLLRSDTIPSVETNTLSTFGTFRRICGRSGTAIKLRDVEENDD
jgi:hypothetical protein